MCRIVSVLCVLVWYGFKICFGVDVNVVGCGWVVVIICCFRWCHYCVVAVFIVQYLFIVWVVIIIFVIVSVDFVYVY